MRINKCFIGGRLTGDPEMRYTVQGTAVTSFTIAVNRYKEGADFIRIKAFKKLAETCNEFLRKGSEALVWGRLQIDSYETADGQKKWSTEIIAEDMQMPSKKKDSVMPQHEIPQDAPSDERIPF